MKYLPLLVYVEIDWYASKSLRPVTPYEILGLRLCTTSLCCSMNGIRAISHASDAEGNDPHLLSFPNFVDPSYRIDTAAISMLRQL